ncbi:MAG: hypothetical protein Q4F88_06085 [Eubacteriales bacterium]|nr:hypothetical protein [Eubacteriales bacterium]
MKIIFWAYRDWAIKVYESIEKYPKVEKSIFCYSKEEVLKQNLSEYDLLFTCGLSEEIGEEISNRIYTIGVHCAELDRYSYGTPIQLQIIDGIHFSKHRIFKFVYDKDSKRAHTHSREYANEVDLDLTLNMQDILEQLTVTSKILFHQFIDEYPNNIWRKWPEEEIVREKREPKDSSLPKEKISQMTTEELYNFFRCLESPYPNGYIEDEKGYLYIEKVRYKMK